MRTLKHLTTMVARWAKSGWHLVTVTVHRGLERLHQLYVLVTARHVRRWAGDSGYRRTLLAAVTALAATVVPHPVAAAALGAAVAEWSPRRHDPYEYDDEDDEFAPTSRRRLWDSYT